MKFITKSAESTYEIGKYFGERACVGEIYCLSGELGAGKTVFTKGFAAGIGISDDVTSPTFSIVNYYNGMINLFHFDVYRINSIYEMEETGYEDLFNGDGVCLIEWAEIIRDIIPDNAKWITINKNNENDEHREIIMNRSE